MAPIFVLTGAPGVGKSSVALALAARFDQAFVIPMDDLREWVVSGRMNPIPTWNEETTRQFELAYAATADLADRYSQAGFTVIIDHVVFPNEERLLQTRFGDRGYFVVMLDCQSELNHHRNQTRTGKQMNPSVLTSLIDHIRKDLQPADHWLKVDSSGLSVEETVNRIIDLVGAKRHG